jgi:hypothetical protein
VPFEIQPNHKFAVIALDTRVADGLQDVVELGGGLRALTTAPVEVDQTWREWLGSIEHDHYHDCSLYLLASAPSQNPGVLDHEHSALERQVFELMYALHLGGAARFGGGGGLILKGSRSGDHVEIRQHSRLPAHYSHERLAAVEINEAVLNAALPTAAALRTLYQQVPGPPLGTAAAGHAQDHGRLRRGFNALLQGLRGHYANARLHQFVRAAEGVIHPPIAKSKATFVHRGGIITGRSAEVRDVLGAIYDLRSAEEHLNEWQAVVPGEPTATLRSAQVEILACEMYRRVLPDAGLRNEFASDASTHAFWAQQDHVTAARWAPPIEIREAPLLASGKLEEE